MQDLPDRLKQASLNVHVHGIEKIGPGVIEGLCREAAVDLHERRQSRDMFLLDKLCRSAVLGIEDDESSIMDLLDEAAEALEEKAKEADAS